CRYGQGSNVAVFAAQVGDDPAAVALRDMSGGQGDGLAAAQTATDQQGQQGAIALALSRPRIGSVDERFGLGPGQPISGAYAPLLDARNLLDGGCRLGVEQSVSGGLAR